MKISISEMGTSKKSLLNKFLRKKTVKFVETVLIKETEIFEDFDPNHDASCFEAIDQFSIQTIDNEIPYMANALMGPKKEKWNFFKVNK